MKRFLRGSRAKLFFALGVCALIAGTAFAQRPRIFIGGWRYQPRWAKPQDFDGSFNYCRGYYTSNRREDGGSGWNTDYAAADNNFSVRLLELTRVPVKINPDGQPDYVVVQLADPLLFRCPLLHLEDAGTARLSDEEVVNLRAYLLKGGFIQVDDYWGTAAWNQWAEEIGRVLPPQQYPIVDIPLDHPIMRMLYEVKEIPQVSSIQFWLRSGGRVSERGLDSPHPNFRAIFDEQGRAMVVMAHNTDIPDTWEREGENQEYFNLFAPAGYAVGVNIILYALTH